MAKVVRMPHHEAMENELCGDVAELDDGRPPTTMKIVQSSIPDHDSGKSSYKVLPLPLRDMIEFKISNLCRTINPFFHIISKFSISQLREREEAKKKVR